MAGGKLSDNEREKQIKELEKQAKTFNLRTLTFEAAKTISEQIHKDNPVAVVVDVYDRGYDYHQLFEYETQIGNLFVVRSKLNRCSNELIINENCKEKAIKLKNQMFLESLEKTCNKVRFRGKTYINAKGYFEWNYVEIDGKTYSVVRVQFYSSKDKKIFTEPMLLISNMQVDDDKLAMLAFDIYMTRSKIEEVFKFCKTTLGWETIQISEFECVKNLLSLVFYVSGYLYEIEDIMTKDSTMIWLAELGGGKGNVSSTYILRGLAKLINFRLAQKYIKEHNISENQIDEILEYSKSNE